MAKDAYWFKHDAGAGRDIKMLELKSIYSHWGIGVYWEVIEVLREQNNYRFEVKKLQLLCSLIQCDDFTKFNNFYNDCLRIGLLNKDDKYLYSNSLLDRMNKWEAKKRNGSEPKAKSKRIKGNKRREEERREEDINKREIEFREGVMKLPVSDKYKLTFFNYWSEKNKSGTKMKWELEKTWDLDKRMQRWVNNTFNNQTDKPRVPIN